MRIKFKYLFLLIAIIGSIFAQEFNSNNAEQELERALGYFLS